VGDLKSAVEGGRNNRFILDVTRRFLANGRILEGGCGLGDKVYCLHSNGFSAFGVDFAEETVRRINECFPELDVRVGDVRRLEFSDGFFDGYWSIGVIEHFREGYGSVLNEMRRVVKPGGYVFLAFPYMSPLRRLKARLGLYPEYLGNNDIGGFYQYILDEGKVRGDFEKAGFTLKYRRPYDGIKGLKDEVSFFKPFLQHIYDYNGALFLVNRFRSLLSTLLSFFSAHMLFMVFRKDG